MFRKFDEKAFKEDWNKGLGMKELMKKFNLPCYAVYYHAGRLGLKPRLMKQASRVRSTGILMIPAGIVDRLGFKYGEFVKFEVLDEDEKMIKLVKV